LAQWEQHTGESGMFADPLPTAGLVIRIASFVDFKILSTSGAWRDVRRRLQVAKRSYQAISCLPRCPIRDPRFWRGIGSLQEFAAFSDSGSEFGFQTKKP
jgi:hypothetical protein